ncbi:MAG TPA: c-type cytochrome [Candidatus Accumulibacter phosphatis]|nr:MAG: Flavocytochrome c cytochrome subunit [Candidatus Accumulibacter sp. SK-11]HAY28113.1 cytochrome C [Accumulibacter sp.]HCV14443.1 cytochrome C [Accumulibacter sp.]HRL74339.1 c-type cytochrome [Candidatus Accumulibacter phosphatis]HRQ95263.1 c-type cytochrome [Candidatus Accumulibacter phosphatis]
MKRLSALVALTLLTSSLFAQAADPERARNLAATCANCHGTDGRPVAGSGIDPLAGIEKRHSLQKLADFKSGQRPGTIMPQIAKGYTDEQLELIAAYFAAQK